MVFLFLFFFFHLGNKCNGKLLGGKTAVKAKLTAQKKTDPDEVYVPMKLSGGGQPKPPKFAKTDDSELQKLTTLTRSLTVWKSIEHEKCALSKSNVRNNLCSLCCWPFRYFSEHYSLSAVSKLVWRTFTCSHVIKISIMYHENLYAFCFYL